MSRAYLLAWQLCVALLDMLCVLGLDLNADTNVDLGRGMGSQVKVRLLAPACAPLLVVVQSFRAASMAARCTFSGARVYAGACSCERVAGTVCGGVTAGA